MCEMRSHPQHAAALARADELKAFVEVRAASRGLDVNTFFPDPHDAQGIAAAKALCGRYLARTECLRWAIKTREEYGAFGGLTQVERGRLRRRTARDRPLGEPRHAAGRLPGLRRAVRVTTAAPSIGGDPAAADLKRFLRSGSRNTGPSGTAAHYATGGQS